MIGKLQGIVDYIGDGFVILLTHGVGYKVYTPEYLTHKSTVELWIETVVREDSIRLFGFSSLATQDLFNMLTGVSGVGPKMAITILSGLKLSDLIVAIINEDANMLSKIKGLGKKSAERICLELKDKISTAGIDISDSEPIAQNYNESALNDAVETLIALGVNKNEAYRLARSKATEDITAEEIILKVLKDLGR